MVVMNRSSKKKQKKEKSFYSKEDGCWLKPRDPLGESKTD